VTSERILLSAPDVGYAEVQAVARAIESGWVAPIGPDVDAFEREVSDFVGVKNAVALNSGTAALHLALKAVGVVAEDLVITATMTFVATANAISYLGACPVFVDSCDDGTLSPTGIEEAIVWVASQGRRIGAILAVDIYGRAANYTKIAAIASLHGIPLVADAAEALGASHEGGPAGSFGGASVFSFNGNKIMTTSGGGMLVTSDDAIAEYARYLSSQAREPATHYEHVEVGYNYRMSNVLAALGRAQLDRLPDMIRRRRELRNVYRTYFASVQGVSLLPGNPDEDNCWLTAILVNPDAGWTPTGLLKHLDEAGIESRLLWKPMHLQPLYRKAHFMGGDVAEGLFRAGLALPSGSSLSDAEVDRVIGTVSSFLAR